MKKQLMVVFSLSVVSGLVLILPSWGQAPAQPKAAQEVPARLEATQIYGTGGGAQTVYSVPGGFATGYPAVAYPDPRGGAAGSELNNIVRQLRDTEDEAKKAELTKALEAAVSKYFDDDMKARETELTKLEERLTKLRSQLDRRRKAKAEITQLQTKVLVNEADGLGFSGTSGVEGAAGLGGFYAPGGRPGFGLPNAVYTPAAPGAAPTPVPVAPRR